MKNYLQCELHNIPEFNIQTSTEKRERKKFLTIIDNTLPFLIPAYDTIILTGELNINFVCVK